MQRITVNGNGSLVEDLEKRGPIQRIRVGGETLDVQLLREPTRDEPDLILRVKNRVLIATLGDIDNEGNQVVRLNGHPLTASLVADAPPVPGTESERPVEGPVIISSPMSGRIVALKVSLGSTVDAGQPVVVLEAMKMENEIAAPKKGVVSALHVALGSLVKAGDKIAVVE